MMRAIDNRPYDNHMRGGPMRVSTPSAACGGLSEGSKGQTPDFCEQRAALIRRTNTPVACLRGDSHI